MPGRPRAQEYFDKAGERLRKDMLEKWGGKFDVQVCARRPQTPRCDPLTVHGGRQQLHARLGARRGAS